MQSPSQKWLEEMADGEDKCQSVAAGVPPENVTQDAITAHRSGPSWRWLDANHGVASNTRPKWPYVAAWMMLFLFAVSNFYWIVRKNRLNEQVQIQSNYIELTTNAMRDLTSLLNKNGVYFKWQDGKPVQVFDE